MNLTGSVNKDELITKIQDYGNKGGFIDGNNLTKLKAIDAIKDGASTELSKNCFGLTNNIQNPEDLKKHIKAVFEEKVRINEMRKLTYTRIKDRGSGDVIMDGVNYDYYIPDCGPLYSKGNGKTPVVKTSGDQEPIALYSLGNKLDTGPSSSNTINLKRCSNNTETYNIDKETMETLGYPDCSFNSINDYVKEYTFNFNINSTQIDKTKFFEYAIGNLSKKKELTNSNTTENEKRKLVFIKSLGDTLIVYYWLWACKTAQSAKTIALLTCDSVVAFQADIFCENNGHFLLNYTETGEKKISTVYYKGKPPNYETLFYTEKTMILKRYQDEINKFQNNNNVNENVKFTFTGLENRVYTDPSFINLIKVGLEAMRQDVSGRVFNLSNDSGASSYKDLKKMVLIPIIKTLSGRKINLIRTRNSFCMSDTKFLSEFLGNGGKSKGGKNKTLYEVFLMSLLPGPDPFVLQGQLGEGQVVEGQLGGKKGGRNEDTLYSEWSANIINGAAPTEPFYYQPFISSFGILRRPRLPISSDELAITLLRIHVNKIFQDKIKSLDYLNILYYNIPDHLYQLSIEEDRENKTKEGSIFDYLTYIFHYEPDYTTLTIERLIDTFIGEYSRTQDEIHIINKNINNNMNIDLVNSPTTKRPYHSTGGKKTQRKSSKQNKKTRRKRRNH